MFIRKHWLFKAEVPKPEDYIGHHVKIGDRVIECERIVGNLIHPTKYEITCKGKQYLISMLDFHAQMNGETVSQAEIDAFDETTMEHIQKLPEKGKLWIPPHLKNPKN